MRGLRCEVLGALGLFVATVVVFWPACEAQFVNYDDTVYVTDNPRVLGGLSAPDVAWALTTFHAGNWHPLTWLSLQLDASLFGTGPWGFHFTNVLLHAASAAALFLALRMLTGTVWRSAVVASLFALHPLHVESVAWVAERKDTLSGLFWMLTLLAYGWYVRRPGGGRYALVVLALALGLLAKPMLVTLPCVLLLLDYWPLRRAALQAGPGVGKVPARSCVAARPRPPLPAAKRLPASAGWRALVLEKLPLFGLAVCSCIVTWAAQQHGKSVASWEVIPLASRLANAVVACGTYLWAMLWPTGLAVFYPHPGAALPAWRVASAAVFLGATSLLILWPGRHKGYLVVGWLWYLGTLVPVLGLVQVGDQARADRYTYLPLVGIFLLVVWGVADLAQRWQGPRLLAGLTAAVLAVCALGTREQLLVWRDSRALWTHALDVGQQSSVAHNNLGGWLQSQGDLEGARQHYISALKIDPNFSLAQNNLGKVLRRLGDLDGAMQAYARAVELNPTLADAHVNLGALLEARGYVAAAIDHYTQALALDPALPQAHYNLGLALARQRHLSEAVPHFAEAVRLDPTFASAYANLGLVLGRLGKWREAAEALAAAVQLQPDSARGHIDLAHALFQQGQRAAALAEYEEATRLEPDWLEAANRTAWSLATHPDAAARNGQAALELAQNVCQATGGRNPAFLDTLAAAQAELGQFAEAVRTGRAALALNPPTPLKEHIEARLRRYEGGRP
jgi:tetratricopeptide (TPR) repeat protein